MHRDRQPLRNVWPRKVSRHAIVYRTMRSLIERNSQVRALVKAEPVQRALHSVRGSQAVHERTAFLARQLRGRGVGTYRLRNDVKVSVRHGTPDMSIFTRVFWRGIYNPPAEIRHRLRPPIRVLDLGANIGLFAASLGPRAIVTAVEADPYNATLLEEMIATNGLPWTVIRGYASSQSGTIRFARGQHCFSRDDPSGELTETIDVFPLFAGIDLLKMDIEGAEWAILHLSLIHI